MKVQCENAANQEALSGQQQYNHQHWQALLGMQHGRVISSHARRPLPTHEAVDTQVDRLGATLSALSMPGDGGEGLLNPNNIEKCMQQVRHKVHCKLTDL